MTVRVLYVSQYYPPEMGAPAARVSELARRWAAAGDAVTVLTAFPSHPTGIVPEGYRGDAWRRERDAGVDLIRVRAYTAPNRGVVRRSLAYGSFLASALLLGLPLVARGPRPDVVIGTSPQILCALAASLVARALRRPFVLEVRDLWPDSILEVGAIRNRWAIGALRALERHLYRSAARIVVVTHAFRDRLVERGVPPERIAVVTNGVDLARFDPATPGAPVRARYGLEGAFVAAYVGTIGMAHGIGTVLEAARLARDSDPDLRFLVVGEGAERAALERQAAAEGTGVTFAGEQPRDAVPGFLAAADAVLVLLRDRPLFRTVLPSKMFECMAMERPIVLGVEGEARRVLEEAGAGEAVAPEDAAAIVRTLRAWRADPERAREAGRRGRAHVVRHYDRDRLAGAYRERLAEVVREGRG